MIGINALLEGDMDVPTALFIGLIWIGTGTFFIGIGVLWWVSILAKQTKE